MVRLAQALAKASGRPFSAAERVNSCRRLKRATSWSTTPGAYGSLERVVSSRHFGPGLGALLLVGFGSGVAEHFQADLGAMQQLANFFMQLGFRFCLFGSHHRPFLLKYKTASTTAGTAKRIR